MKISDRFLKEAIRIGDDILSKQIKTEEGICWKTMKLDSSKNISLQISESIYSGVGGIILFFIELYKQTGDEMYLETSIQASEWLIYYLEENPSTYYAFFTGRMGSTYVLMQMYQLTKEEKYRKHAIRIALNAEDFLKKPNQVNDLINGTSGTLLGLLLLYSETNEDKLLPIMDRFVRHLIEHALHGYKGLYWDKNTRQIKGLCGFSHGASGIGYVFLQLGFYFKNPSFYWMAEQTFAYENYFYNKKTGNWPDFRKGIYTDQDFEEHSAAYISENYDFFNIPGNMMAWCHGAPGIGLSRIHAWKFLKKSYLKKDVENSLRSTERVITTPLKRTQTFTLCHGKGGNAMLFWEAGKNLKNGKPNGLVKKTARQALEFHKEYGFYVPGFPSVTKKQEDLSLFMGNAGIGYFYLMCNDSEKIPSILSPSVKDVGETDITALHGLNITLPQLRKKVLSKIFPKTISFIEEHLMKTEIFFKWKQHEPEDVKLAFNSRLKLVKKRIQHGRLSELKELIHLENKKLEIELDTNPVMQYIKSVINRRSAKQLLSLTDKKLLKKQFKVNENVFLDPNICISSSIANKQNERSRQSVLLLKTPMKTEIFQISPFTVKLLNIFTDTFSCRQVINQLTSELNLVNKSEEIKSKKIILNQIRECIRALFLVEL